MSTAGKRKQPSSDSHSSKRQQRNAGTDRQDDLMQPLLEVPDLMSCGSQLHALVYPNGIPAGPSLAEEWQRRIIINQLKERLLCLCGKGTATSRYPSLAFERWLLASLALRTSVPTSDPLIPQHGSAEPGLISDLQSVGFSATQAQSIAQTLADESKAMVVRPSASAGLATDRVTMNQKDDNVVLTAGNACGRQPAKQTLHQSIYRKLMQLFRFSNSKASMKEKLDAAHVAMFKVCIRYGSLGGPGFQAAVNHDAFQDHIGTAVELFASPFNCAGKVFGSAFPDTDACFGSLGSAFDWFPLAYRQGSVNLEANPPFVSGVINSLVEMIVREHSKFERSPERQAPTVSLIVPTWKDSTWYRALVTYRWPSTVLDDCWVQPPDNEAGKPSTLRKIPTPCVMFSI